MVDELEIFDRALSQSEVQAIYNAGSAGKCRPYTPDHFLCYKVKTSKGDAKFQKIAGVDLVDSFEARKFDVIKPLALCNPADKNGGGIKRLDDRLVRYQVKLVKKTCEVGSPQNALAACKKEEDCGGVRDQTAFCAKQPKRQKVLRIHTNNQFGPEVLDAVKELQLCVPSVAAPTSID